MRHPGKQHERTDREEVPAVTRPCHEPCERGERTGDSRAGDGRLPADGEDVRHDHGDRHELAGDAGQSEQPSEPEHPGGEERDVLPGHGQEVVKAGGAEVVLHICRQPLVLAENDAEDDPPPNAGRATRDCPLDPVAQPIAQTRDPPTASDLTPARGVEHDLDALALEPGALVEPVPRRFRLRDADRRLQDGSARR